MVKYACLSMCTQANLEPCSSDGHYAVVGSQSKDVPPVQPYEVPTKCLGITKKQVCVYVCVTFESFRVLACVCMVVVCSCMCIVVYDCFTCAFRVIEWYTRIIGCMYRHYMHLELSIRT